MGRVTEPEGAARRYGGDVSVFAAREGGAVAGRSAGGKPRPRNPVLRGGTLAVAGLLAFAGSASLAAAPPAAASATAVTPSSVASSGTPFLPEPTGSRPVGTESLYLKDTSRPDPWVPEVKARELMVSLWYPATSPGRRRAPYMTAKESELLLKEAQLTGVPLDVLSRTRTNAFTDVKPAGRRRGLPLVVLSPGFTKPRSTLTALAEDLASRGYVVAAIDHTYENVATTFPDGRVTTCVPCEGDHDQTLFTKLSKGRAADVSFVLDQLTGPHAKWKGGSLIDPSRIAMAGHSAGGASVIAAMVKDSRLRAGIDIDGTTPVGILDGKLSRPFMFLGKPGTYTPGAGGPADTWERDWKLMTGWKRWLLVTGTEHESFTDIMLLANQLGVDGGAKLSGARSLEITRRYVGAFFDQHLLKRKQPLLDRPSARHPEVKHCVPETKTCA